MSGGPTSVEDRIALETERLEKEFRGVFSAETVARFVSEARARLRRADVDEYLPTLVARYAREVLRASARAARGGAGEPPEVLFVCVQNAGRSQMAAALTRRLSGGRVVVRSAGSAPAHEIHSVVDEAIREIGLDPAEEFPKPLADEFVRAADVIVTMGCGDACPVFPGRRYEDWKVADPAGRPIDDVRAIRADIRARVEALLRPLGVEPRDEAA